MNDEIKLKHRILVVDDEEVVFKAISDSLMGEYDLIYAENGEKGIKLLEESSPDLVLLDYRMPGIDGAEFLRRVQLSSDDPFSVIVLTGHARGQEIAECFDLGITSFLRKPFNVYELNGLVKQSLRFKESEKKLREKRDLEIALQTIRTVSFEVRDSLNCFVLLRDKIVEYEGENSVEIDFFNKGFDRILSYINDIDGVCSSWSGGDGVAESLGGNRSFPRRGEEIITSKLRE